MTEPTRAAAARSLGVRFLASYFVLYAFPYPIGELPLIDKLAQLYDRAVESMVLTVGANVIGIESISTTQNGSGDRTYDYVLLFCQLGLAVAATLVWTLVDRKSQHRERVLEGVRIYVAVFLGMQMLEYGFLKIFQLQFLSPPPGELAKSYGESSPMNLLWTFMGVSGPYQMAAGFLEFVPGVLLLFRRTRVVGALVLVAVLANVVLLNLCFDVPVKLFSIHLWLMALFLAAPALPRLAATLVLERPVPSAPAPRLFESERTRRAAIIVYAILLCVLAYRSLDPHWRYHVEEASLPAEAIAVRDLFDVAEMTADGQALPPANAARWKRVWIRARQIRIVRTDGTSQVYRAAQDIRGPGALELRRMTDQPDARRATLALRAVRGGYVLEGDVEGTRVVARLARIGSNSSLLMTRGFHWVSDEAFNR
jgi:hypothetical protein